LCFGRDVDYLIVASESSTPAALTQQQLYEAAVGEFGPAIDRLASAWEADQEKRRDLRQEIHFQIWRSFEVFDRRCSIRTWIYRIAHNTAVTWVTRERRFASSLVSLDEIEFAVPKYGFEPDIDRTRSLERLSALIHKLKPLDRQIMLAYLEDVELTAIAEITGLSAANVSMKIHRLKNVLARNFFEETTNG
jgi:RNA polymerase sigma-70 factor (ECF subfamily)